MGRNMPNATDGLIPYLGLTTIIELPLMPGDEFFIMNSARLNALREELNMITEDHAECQKIAEEDAIFMKPPSKDKIPWNVTINSTDNGYLVQIGCRMFVMDTKDRLLRLLDRYLTDPRKAVQELSPGEAGVFQPDMPPEAMRDPGLTSVHAAMASVHAAMHGSLSPQPCGPGNAQECETEDAPEPCGG